MELATKTKKGERIGDRFIPFENIGICYANLIEGYVQLNLKLGNPPILFKVTEPDYEAAKHFAIEYRRWLGLTADLEQVQ